MLEALKFVQRATADKDIVRILTHICVKDGKLQGADSRMAIEVACPEMAGYSFTVPAEKFIKAVTACKGQPNITVGEDGTIKVSKSRFRVTLPILPSTDFPTQSFKPDDAVEIKDFQGFRPALRKILPFISLDASRPWSLGVNLCADYFYATNNVSMARVPVSWEGPNINLPRYVVEEILDICQPILSIWASPTSISFEFPEGWFRAQLYADSWPQGIASMFDKEREFEPVPEGLSAAIEQIVPFCPDVKFPTIHFTQGSITTANGLQSAEIGFDWHGVGVYRAEVIQLVLGAAKEWTPSAYPNPVFFRGDGIEGMCVGVKS